MLDLEKLEVIKHEEVGVQAEAFEMLMQQDKDDRMEAGQINDSENLIESNLNTNNNPIFDKRV